MNILPIKTHDEKWTGGVICVCYHCGTKFGSANGTCAQFCSSCRSAEQRAAVDASNREIWTAEGREYHCAFCEAEAAQRSRRKAAALANDKPTTSPEAEQEQRG